MNKFSSSFSLSSLAILSVWSFSSSFITFRASSSRAFFFAYMQIAVLSTQLRNCFSFVYFRKNECKLIEKAFTSAEASDIKQKTNEKKKNGSEKSFQEAQPKRFSNLDQYFLYCLSARISLHLLNMAHGKPHDCRVFFLCNRCTISTSFQIIIVDSRFFEHEWFFYSVEWKLKNWKRRKQFGKSQHNDDCCGSLTSHMEIFVQLDVTPKSQMESFCFSWRLGLSAIFHF